MQFKCALIFLARSLVSASIFDFLYPKEVLIPKTEAMDPKPGSITSTLSVESLNQIVQLAAPLMMNEFLSNKTYEIGFRKRGWLGIYDF